MRRALFAGALIAVALVSSAGAAQQPPARGVRELAAVAARQRSAVRAQAACSLRELGDRAAEAIPALVALMDDATPLKADVCETNRNWGGRDGDVTTPGQQAAAALVATGSRAFDPVAGALQAPIWFARRNAAWALGALRDPRGVPLLIDALGGSRGGGAGAGRVGPRRAPRHTRNDPADRPAEGRGPAGPGAGRLGAGCAARSRRSARPWSRRCMTPPRRCAVRRRGHSGRCATRARPRG